MDCELCGTRGEAISTSRLCAHLIFLAWIQDLEWCSLFLCARTKVVGEKVIRMQGLLGPGTSVKRAGNESQLLSLSKDNSTLPVHYRKRP